MRTRATDPHPTLVAYGAPLFYPTRRDMPLEEAIARSLRLLAGEPLVLLSLPVVILGNEKSLDLVSLLRQARALHRESELGMVLDLTGKIGKRRRLRRFARQLKPRKSILYLVSSESRYVRRSADVTTPRVVEEWGFRMNCPEESFLQFLLKHLPSEALRTRLRDPRSTLAAYGAPLHYRARRDMPLEEAIARSLRLLRDDADSKVLLSLPVVILGNEASLDMKSLIRHAGALRVEPQLGMLLDLCGKLGNRRRLRGIARQFKPRKRVLWLTPSDPDFPRAGVRTPPVVARWGFRMNLTEEVFLKVLRRLLPSF